MENEERLIDGLCALDEWRANPTPENALKYHAARSTFRQDVEHRLGILQEDLLSSYAEHATKLLHAWMDLDWLRTSYAEEGLESPHDLRFLDDVRLPMPFSNKHFCGTQAIEVPNVIELLSEESRALWEGHDVRL